MCTCSGLPQNCVLAFVGHMLSAQPGQQARVLLPWKGAAHVDATDTLSITDEPAGDLQPYAVRSTVSDGHTGHTLAPWW